MARRGREEDTDELRAHLELQTRKYMAQGMQPEEARRRARLEFGGFEKTLEECRETNSWSWFEAAVRNARHCLRSLGRSPAFTFVSLLLLTIGIASNVAVFSTIDAVFLRPLPVEHPDELVRITSFDKDGRAGSLPSTVLDTLGNSRAFNGLCGFRTAYVPAEVAGSIRQVRMAAFSGGCFGALGLHVQLGRALGPDDDRANAGRVAVVTGAFWQEALGGRRDVLGSAIRLDDALFTIVGVTQKGFTGLLLGFPEPVMIPLRQQSSRTRDGRPAAYWWVDIFARRVSGVSYSQAAASVISGRNRLLEQSMPPHYNAIQRKDFLARGLTVAPARTGADYFLRRRFGECLYAIFGLSAAILLMTCLNLISLSLARGLTRRREVAIRLAIGARRAHIATIFVLENAVLLFAGAALGVLVGLWMARIILESGGRMFGNFHLNIAFDSRVAFFLGGTLLLLFAAFTAASIWQARRLAGPEILKRGGRGRDNSLAQKILLAAHIGLTLALVSSASLFGASIRNMYAIDLGIQPRGLWSVALAPSPAGYRNFTPEPYYRDLLARIESLPGVVAASLSNDVPFYNSSREEAVAAIDTEQPSPELQARVMPISDRFFQTMGAQIRVGEDFRRAGDSSAEPAVIISKSLAERLGSPHTLIGHHLRVGADAKYQRVKIAGVASDMVATLEDQRPFTVFTNFWQDRLSERYPVLLIRTANSQLDQGAVRRIVERKGREYVERFTTVAEEIDNALVENRFLAYLSGAFSALALGIAAVGLFGLLSYQVSDRTAEIGIRMALGARPFEVQTLFFRQIVVLLAIGSAAGAMLLFAAQRAIASLLYGASASNLYLFALSIAVLAATAIAGAWIPVRRAARIDPSQALHHA